MAMYRLNLRAISRGYGNCIVAKAAYNAGQRMQLWEPWKTIDFSWRFDVVHHEVVHAFGWDSEELWNRAELHRPAANALLGREALVALPWELSLEGKLGLAMDLSHYLHRRFNVAVDVSVHSPPIVSASPLNWHAHLLFTRDELGPDGFGPTLASLDENPQGRGRALRARGPQETTLLRAAYCDMENAALEREGRPERVDHRSYIEQGLDRIPTRPLGRRLAKKERRGEPTRVGDENRRIAIMNRVAERFGLSPRVLNESHLTLDAIGAEYQAFKTVMLQAVTELERFERNKRGGRRVDEGDVAEARALYEEFWRVFKEEVEPEFRQLIRDKVSSELPDLGRSLGLDR